uniref:(northern house mosquito) hypothetical protein n=1 Tax=Culex pipiens TaxID=7175 RepID=A0A8D8IBL1_CULPI
MQFPSKSKDLLWCIGASVVHKVKDVDRDILLRAKIISTVLHTWLEELQMGRRSTFLKGRMCTSLPVSYRTTCQHHSKVNMGTFDTRQPFSLRDQPKRTRPIGKRSQYCDTSISTMILR